MSQLSTSIITLAHYTYQQRMRRCSDPVERVGTAFPARQEMVRIRYPRTKVQTR
jgi:hypothetical protein